MELVAKSYQNYPQIGEVFVKNGKNYIAIKESCDRCGGNGYSNHPSWAQNNNGKCFKCDGLGYVIEEVRAYTQKEYEALEKASIKRKEKAEAERIANIETVNIKTKERLGFAEGFITVVLGNTYPIKDELKDAGARFSPIFGWYFIGHDGEEYLESQDFSTFKVLWEDVFTKNRDYVLLKDASVLKEWFESKTIKPSTSSFQGEIGEKIERKLEIICVFDFTGRFGITHLHTMEDENKNVYVWSTASKKLEVGKTFNIKATVKDHTLYKNVEQTILTRCVMK